MKNCNNDKESSYLMYWDTNNLYGWAMSQKLPVDCFESVKNMSKFDENFKKFLMRIAIKDTYLKQMLNIPRIHTIYTMIYHS